MKELKKILESRNEKHIEELFDMFEDLIEEFKTENPMRYNEIKYNIHKMAYGEHLSESMAQEWVSNMENKDGSKGGHWTYDQSKAYAGNHDKCDFYAALNMCYSDYYNPKFDTSVYVQLANDWLDDKDVGAGKTLKYYMLVVC